MKDLARALPGSQQMFLLLSLLSLDEFAISSSCSLDAGDFHSAPGSPRLSPSVHFLFHLLLQQCSEAVAALSCTPPWETPVLAFVLKPPPSQRTRCLCLSRVLSPFSAPKLSLAIVTILLFLPPSLAISPVKSFKTFPFHEALNQDPSLPN